MIPSLLWSVLACIRPLTPGPDLGPCAERPEGVFHYGDAGIGTCLAGPADIAFFGQDGGTFLAVVNADPYRLFRTGSLLVIDWDDLAARLEDDPPMYLRMDEVRAYAYVGADDDDGDGIADNPFFGGFAYVPQSQTAVLTSRLSEDGVLRTAKDDAFVLDLSRMELPGGEIELAGKLLLEDDPQLAVADPTTSYAYVGNLTDHSVSVLTSDTDGAVPLAEVDVAPEAGARDAVFDDVDGDGSVAELTRLAIGIREDLRDEDFLLTYVDASLRLFVPTPATDDGDVVGLLRWGSGGGEYTPTAFGLEQFYDETGVNGFGGTIGEPFVEVDGEGLSTVWFSRDDGTIWRALQNTAAGEWVTEATPVRSFGGVHAAPSAAPLDEGLGLYTERIGAGDVGAVHLAISGDGVTFDEAGAVLVPPDGVSYEQPFVVLDTAVDRYRMWLTVHTGDDRVIGLSESDDGRTWSDVLVVSSGRRAIAAPVVQRLDGRYLMWTTVKTASGAWAHAAAWSWDGVSFTDPVVVAPSEVVADRPPRAAVLAQPTGAWRIDALTGGPLGSLLPAGLDLPVEIAGLELMVAHGHELPNAVDDDRAADPTVFPGSAQPDGQGGWRVYATALDRTGRSRILVYGLRDAGRAEAGEALPEWELVADGADWRDDLELRPAEMLGNPVAVRTGDGWTVFATLSDRTSARIVRMRSDDGLTFGPLDRTPVIRGEGDGWDAAGQYAGSIEVRDGRFHLWYTGDDGSRTTIGSAVADELTEPFRRELGLDDDYAFGTGLPGSFDDSSVADPLVVQFGGETRLYYAGFDGVAWHLGHATRDARGRFVRRIDEVSQLSIPAMNGAQRTFSALGVRSPVLLTDDDGGLVLLYSGQDGLGARIGRARVPAFTPDVVYAAQRFPTAGDTLSFLTLRGGKGAQVVELGQTTRWYVSTAVGFSDLELDAERGFLYATSKLFDDVLVVDVRDDTAGGFDDENVFDLETVIRIDTGNTGAGYRDAIVSQSRSLLYLAQRSPDALVAIDLDQVADDGSKAPTDRSVLGVLPLPSALEDLGADTAAVFGGTGMAMTDDERLLLVPHFRQNAMSVFDLDQGAFGAEIAWIPWVGENPVETQIAPDQRWAVVANYVGTVTDNQAESSLAVVDLDPSSDTYLEVVTWLVNR